VWTYTNPIQDRAAASVFVTTIPWLLIIGITPAVANARRKFRNPLEDYLMLLKLEVVNAHALQAIASALRECITSTT
jgi:hypothetical protein